MKTDEVQRQSEIAMRDAASDMLRITAYVRESERRRLLEEQNSKKPEEPLCENCGEESGAHHMGGVEHTFAPGKRVKRLSQFDQGYLCAVANILNTHGEYVVARDVMGGAGVGENLRRGQIDDLDFDTLLKHGLVKDL